MSTKNKHPRKKRREECGGVGAESRKEKKKEKKIGFCVCLFVFSE
jgi:hypothetical protein